MIGKLVTFCKISRLPLIKYVAEQVGLHLTRFQILKTNPGGRVSCNRDPYKKNLILGSLAKLRSEIVWHRIFAVPAFICHFRSYIAVRKLLCRPPLISPACSVAVRASGKALISWEKSRNYETRQQTKKI